MFEFHQGFFCNIFFARGKDLNFTVDAWKEIKMASSLSLRRRRVLEQMYGKTPCEKFFNFSNGNSVKNNSW